MTDRAPLPPGSTIGILGGGQLGRMLALAAARLGLRIVIFDPDDSAPAAEVSARHIAAPYDDGKALDQLAAMADVVTYEFENIPTAALDRIEHQVPIRPGRRALDISQDRLTEKRFLTDLGLSVAPFADVTGQADLDRAIEQIGRPAILKTRRFGYDGKGQVRITDTAGGALAQIDNAPAILEGHVDFECEISVIGARGLDGSVACFDPGRNVHRDGILHTTTVPVGIAPQILQNAVLATGQVMNALDYVGVIGVEMFVTKGGLIINEIAPRVHNSGHWTQNACAIDQFEQHIRAISGWPLGDGTRHADAVMENLIGDEVLRAPNVTGAALHLYGKSQTKPGRKMGHVNRPSRRS